MRDSLGAFDVGLLPMRRRDFAGHCYGVTIELGKKLRLLQAARARFFASELFVHVDRVFEETFGLLIDLGYKLCRRLLLLGVEVSHLLFTNGKPQFSGPLNLARKLYGAVATIDD